MGVIAELRTMPVKVCPPSMYSICCQVSPTVASARQGVPAGSVTAISSVSPGVYTCASQTVAWLQFAVYCT